MAGFGYVPSTLGSRPTGALGSTSRGGPRLPSYGGAPGRSPGGGAAPQVRAPQMSAPTMTQFNMPSAQPFRQAPQYRPSQARDPNLGYMAGQGKGLMDPNSDYYKRLSAGMQQQIGGQAAAGERASALRGAWSGFGAGASPEQMMTSADIKQGGLEAQGQAEANLRLQAPQIGAGMLQSTFAPQLGYGQLQEGSRQFGAGLAEQSSQFGAGLGESQRQFGANVGLQQQGMANQIAQLQAQMSQEANMFNAQAQQQQQQMEYQAMMNQMAQAYG